ncbi:MAG: hypothetical protein RLZZ553_948 [Verrucomicrobiota bacterium]|jgi:hypothetical protein
MKARQTVLPTLEAARNKFFANLGKEVLTFVEKSSKQGVVSVASNADFSNRASLEISNAVLESIIGRVSSKKLAGQSLGDMFERHVADFLKDTFLTLSHLRPGKWSVDQVTKRSEDAVADCEQYSHLGELATFCSQHRELAAVLGNDYSISPDVIVTRLPESDKTIDENGKFLGEGLAQRTPLRSEVNHRPILHACVSCKFTLRSDRSQNARAEALNLIRNRKGRTPHIVIVTAECLPSRLASLALGTGDIDCLYHIALPELIYAVNTLDFPDAKDMLETMISGRRIRDITDLPLDLAV